MDLETKQENTKRRGAWTYLLGNVSCAMSEADQTRHNSISTLYHVTKHPRVDEKLRVPFTWMSFLNVSVTPAMKSSYLSWQNAPASQAAAPLTSSLGICHTSLPPFCCFGHHNNNNSVHSSTLGEQTRPNQCQQNKTFTCSKCLFDD